MIIKLKYFCSNCKQYTYKPNVQKKTKQKKKKKTKKEKKTSKQTKKQ